MRGFFQYFLLLISLLLFKENTFGENQYILNNTLTCETLVIPISSLFINPPKITNSIHLNKARFLKNSEISQVLWDKGLRNFTLIGKGVSILLANLSNQAPVPNTAEHTTNDGSISNKSSIEGDVVLDTIRGNYSDIIYQKSGLLIKTKARVIKKLEDNYYLVENMSSGKILKIKGI